MRSVGGRATLFISYSSSETAWGERVHDLLSRAGYRAFLDVSIDNGLVLGLDWEDQLWTRMREVDAVVVLCSFDWLRRPWCVAEAIIGRQQGKTLFVLDITGAQREAMSEGEHKALPAAGRVAAFLDQVQRAEATGTDDPDADARLLGDLEFLHPSIELPEEPYLGLDPYDIQHARIFFGRDEDVRRLVELVDQRRREGAVQFLVVVGASGSGKSSLVRAGVLPVLMNPKRTPPWLVLEPIMPSHGLRGLAAAISAGPLRLGREEHDSVAERGPDLSTTDVRRQLATALEQGFAQATEVLHDRVADVAVAAGAPSRRVLIVVDQLEQAFLDDGPSSKEGRQLLELLMNAANDRAGHLTVLATLRSDSLDEFQNFEIPPDRRDGGGEERKRYRAFTLDPMPRSQLHEAIEGPAALFNVRFEHGLPERLIEETEFVDALPLLSVTLSELWRVGSGDGVLEIQEYERAFPPVAITIDEDHTETIRGVAASVKIEAEKALEEAGFTAPLSDAQDRRLRQLFLSLVAVHEDERPRARTAAIEDLPEIGDVIDRFVEHRLLVRSRRSDGRVMITVTHEALFRVWDRFRKWIGDSRDLLVIRPVLNRAARDWDKHGRDDSRRWPDSRAVDVASMLARIGMGAESLSTVERDFLGPLTSDDVLSSLLSRDLSLSQRARLGFRLNLLVDDRPGTGVDENGLPSLEWLSVIGGEVTLGIPDPEQWAPLREAASRLSNGSVPDPGAGLRSRDLQEDDLSSVVAPFQISKYPVTARQYQTFIDDEDAADEEWWRAPDADDESWWPTAEPPPDFKSRPRVPGNYPATHLSWFEAVAFCRWLSAKTSSVIRLPDEFEWQQAATAGRDQLFPWGNDLPNRDRPDLANTFSSRAFESDGHLAPTTTAVGIFPNGAASTGALDMSGNCWEWCDSDFRPKTDPSDRSSRVVRGGSWVISFAMCTAKYTGQLQAERDTFFVGFRPLLELEGR